jgi:hypothetical protein
LYAVRPVWGPTVAVHVQVLRSRSTTDA